MRGRDIREAFKGDEYQILLAANTFQTGFDERFVCGMYVDKHGRSLRHGVRSIWGMSEWGKESRTIVLFEITEDGVRKLTSAEISGC